MKKVTILTTFILVSGILISPPSYSIMENTDLTREDEYLFHEINITKTEIQAAEQEVTKATTYLVGFSVLACLNLIILILHLYLIILKKKYEVD
ncbi:hypothetical protein [Nostoc sp. CCY0012]|uniref:hypothetical protein n=1 Tax=Nostoc sp. CCY0012 TaxID=1056123 RepID=UPI0039C5DC12